MLEIPEAAVLAEQCRKILTGKIIQRAKAAHSPHGFAFYSGDPALYGAMLEGKTFRGAVAQGGKVALLAENLELSISDGVNLRYLFPGEKHPEKHQLLVECTDGSALYATIQIAGGISCMPEGIDDNFYAAVAREKPSPLTDAFDESYFAAMLEKATPSLSAKAFLATGQRIPGLGNGCLQDILWRAKIHPKRKIATLDKAETETLFTTVKTVLTEMMEKGGRDTEKDLFAKPGGYVTVMSKKNQEMLCPFCGGGIRRMAYLGGNVYVCEHCQK